MKALILFTLTISLLGGCAKSSNQNGFHYAFSITAIVNSKLSKADAAEELAKGAEQLFGAKGFDQADKVALIALQMDPRNFRAGLLHAALDPLRKQKGILIRLQPLAAKSPFLKSRLDSEIKQSQKDPEKHFNWYYLDGKPEISDEKGLQSTVDQQLEAFERFRLFLHSHKEQEITISATNVLFDNVNSRYIAQCKIVETNDSYDMTCPPSVARRQVAMNRADFELLENGLVFYELQATLVNSYEMSGSVEVLKDYAQILPEARQKLYTDLLARAEFGKLRLPNTLLRSRTLGLALAGGLDWALENPASTCRNGQDNSENRPGFYFFKGFCTPLTVLAYVNKFDRMARTSSPVDVGLPGGDTALPTLFDIHAPFEKPIASLKQLGPLQFNKCGQLVKLGDDTFAGFFPNHQSANALALGVSCGN